MFIATVITLLAFLDLFAFSVAMGAISRQLSEETSQVEDSSYFQTCGPLNGNIAPIIVARFNTFWYESVTATQLTDNLDRQKLQLYLLPDDRLKIYSRRSVCWYNTSDVYTGGVYFFEGTAVTLDMQVKSVNESEAGYVTMSIFDGSTSNTAFAVYNITVNPNETTDFSKTFVAHKNAFYCFQSCVTITNCQRAQFEYLELRSEMLYLNYSDWNGRKVATTVTGNNNTIFRDTSLSSMFAAEDLVVVANITEYFEWTYGQLEVTKHYRSLVYVNPAIAAGGIMVVYVAAVLCVCILWYMVQKRRRNGRGRELINPTTST